MGDVIALLRGGGDNNRLLLLLSRYGLGHVCGLPCNIILGISDIEGIIYEEYMPASLTRAGGLVDK